MRGLKAKQLVKIHKYTYSDVSLNENAYFVIIYSLFYAYIN